MENPFQVEKPEVRAFNSPTSSEISDMQILQLTESQYRSMPNICNSDLGEFKRSPLHYYHYKRVKREPTPAQFEGTVIHSMVLEPEHFLSEYLMIDVDERPEPKKTMASKENRDWKKKLEEHAKRSGLQIVERSLYYKALDIGYTLQKSSFIQDLLSNTKKEQSISWEVDGIQYKSRLDMYSPDVCADLKTTLSANPRSFERDIFKYGYHRQGAMYLHGSQAKEFYFIAVEKNPPYAFSIHKLSDEVIAYGIAEYRRLGVELANCIETGIYPGYPCDNEDCTNEVYLPHYLLDDE